MSVRLLGAVSAFALLFAASERCLAQALRDARVEERVAGAIFAGLPAADLPAPPELPASPAVKGATVRTAARGPLFTAGLWSGLAAARLKSAGRLSVADAWVAATAERLGAILVHKDPEFESLARHVRLHPLPYKPGKGGS